MFRSRPPSSSVSAFLFSLSLGCYNTIPQTGGLKEQIYFSVLKAGKSQITAPASSVPDKGCFPGLRRPVFLQCPDMSKRGRKRERERERERGRSLFL